MTSHLGLMVIFAAFVSIVFAVVKAPYQRRLPPEVASRTPQWVTVPQLAVATGKAISPSFWVAPEAAASIDRAWRAYEPPETSVPESASVGFEV